jgi:energy-coupling factor transporter ATP-binding protein EcfA2
LKMKAAENPFRSSAIDKVRFRIPPEELASLASKTLSEGYRCCCLLGPEGSGKTTLLEDLEPILRERPQPIHFYRLREESSRLDRSKVMKSILQLGPDDICLLDGGEVLHWTAWLSLRRAARTRKFRLIATLHRNRGLPVLYRTNPDWATTSQLVVSLAGHTMCPTLESIARKAFTDNSGNVREVFRACYIALMNQATSRSC